MPHQNALMKTVLLDRRSRSVIAILVGILIVAVVAVSAAYWDTALLMGWDAGVITYIAIVFWMMRQADARHTYERAQRQNPETSLTLILVIITSTVALFGAIALATRTNSRGELGQVLHFASGAIAVLGAWVLVHTEFALYYARMYYDEASPGLRLAKQEGKGVVPFRKGLEFPDAEIVDYWDFMYFSFTIAMCYQTSDVTITQPIMRRVTLVHAIISFVFVLVILSFTVNAIGNVI